MINSTTTKIGTLLLIEDRPAQIVEFKTYFEGLGYAVISVHDRLEAEDYLYRTINKGDKPDLIVLDYNLPLQDGPSTCRQLKSNNLLRAIPVLIFAEEDKLSYMTESFKAGAEYYVATGIDGLHNVELRTQAILMRRLRRP